MGVCVCARTYFLLALAPAGHARDFMSFSFPFSLCRCCGALIEVKEG